MSKFNQQMQQQQQQRLQQYYRRQREDQVQQQFRRSSQAASAQQSGVHRAEPTAIDVPTIFISYRHHDSAEIAQQIQTFLKGRFPRDRIFFDVASIDPGADFTAAMETAIVESDLVLVIFGSRWMVDNDGHSVRDKPVDHARFEIEMAIRHKKPIVPVLVNGAVMPDAAELPPSIASFSHLNGVTVHQGDAFYADMDAVARIKEQYAPSPPPVSDTNPSFEAFGGVILVIAIFFAFFPFFPLVPLFMARSQLKGNRALTSTGRALLRASMIISVVALVLQALVACAALVLVIIAAQHLQAQP